MDVWTMLVMVGEAWAAADRTLEARINSREPYTYGRGLTDGWYDATRLLAESLDRQADCWDRMDARMREVAIV